MHSVLGGPTSHRRQHDEALQDEAWVNDKVGFPYVVENIRSNYNSLAEENIRLSEAFVVFCVWHCSPIPQHFLSYQAFTECTLCAEWLKPQDFACEYMAA